jgi:hypothetical protein
LAGAAREPNLVDEIGTELFMLIVVPFQVLLATYWMSKAALEPAPTSLVVWMRSVAPVIVLPFRLVRSNRMNGTV